MNQLKAKDFALALSFLFGVTIWMVYGNPSIFIVYYVCVVTAYTVASVYQTKYGNGSKWGWGWEIALLLIGPILLPLITICLTPNLIQERRTDHNTVRHIFKKYDDSISCVAPGTPRLTKAEQQVQTAELWEFFKEHPSLFRRLPGGVDDLIEYETHCGFHIQTGPMTVVRYFVRWGRLPAFKRELMEWDVTSK